MRHKNLIISLDIILIIVISLIKNSPLMAKGDIYAIGCLENYPYEYINNEGLPAGFSVDRSLYIKLAEDACFIVDYFSSVTCVFHKRKKVVI